MPLSPLSFEHEVTAEEGREDKIELCLGNWIIRANATEFRDLQESLAVPMEYLRDSAEAGSLSGYLFNRPNVINGRVRRLTVRKTRLESAAHIANAGKPLFGGEWVYRQGERFADGRRAYTTSLNLSLNPLRYVRHQPKPRPIGSPDTWGAARITENDNDWAHRGEFALDGRDNWLHDTPYFRAFTNSSRWENHLRRYVQGIGNAMSAELHRATGAYPLDISHPQDFRLKKVEVAFEFAATEPTELLRSFASPAPHALIVADDFSIRGFKYRPPETRRVKNSLSLTVNIRQGVFLRVYAKTNRRIRFEIIHENINHRELLRETPQERGARVSPRPWPSLFDCLARLREHSAREMNTLFRYMRNRSHVPSSPITPLQSFSRADCVNSPGPRNDAHGCIIALRIGRPCAR